MRFLISRLSALGDTVCTLPTAVALKRAHPDCHITWAVDPRFASVVERCSAVDEVVRIKPGLKAKTWPTYAEAFDAAFDMQGLLKSALGIARAKAKVKLGYHWQREGAAFFSSQVLPDPTSFHVVDQYLDVVRAYGVEADRAEFGLAPKPEEIASVTQKLAAGGIPGRFVVINAGAGWVTKRWPAAHVAQLITLLDAEGIRCALIGGKADEDKAVAAEVLSQTNAEVANLVGETSIAELIAVIGEAKVHVGGDTGSTHIAAALGVPAVGLYSMTRPERSCPYGQISRCLYDPSGLASIRPEAAFTKVMEALN